MDALKKVVRISTFFNKSVPCATAFNKWQKENGFKPLTFIKICKTRWHAYLDAICRLIILQPRLVLWLRSPPDGALNTEVLADSILSEEELSVAKAIAYVLLHVRVFDSLAQFPGQATGVKYMRLVQKALVRLEGLYSEVTPESIANFDRQSTACKSL